MSFSCHFYVCMWKIIEGVRNNKYFLLLLLLGKTLSSLTPQPCFYHNSKFRNCQYVTAKTSELNLKNSHALIGLSEKRRWLTVTIKALHKTYFMAFYCSAFSKSSEDPKFTCPILLTDSSCAVNFLIYWRKFILVWSNIFTFNILAISFFLFLHKVEDS